MAKSRESSGVVKDRIMEVASALFAMHGVKGVSIRKIAEEAGINHALVIRYFGSKDELVTEILRREVSTLATAHSAKPGQSAAQTLDNLRGIFLNSLNANQNTMKLIIRSGLDGLSPESYLNPDAERAANVLARWIQSRQTEEGLPDAKLVSVVVMGALFSLVSIAPWLMTSVGLPPDDFEKRKEEIIDTLSWMILQAAGLPLVPLHPDTAQVETTVKP